MPKAHSYRATLERSANSSGTYVLVPDNVMKCFGGRTRVPVVASINGVSWRTTVANMGAGPMIGVTIATREAARVTAGDRVLISIQEDLQERTVELPSDFAKAMTQAQRKAYDAMSYTHRKEYVQWIEGAKKPETRRRRIELACAKLKPKAGRRLGCR